MKKHILLLFMVSAVILGVGSAVPPDSDAEEPEPDPQGSLLISGVENTYHILDAGGSEVATVSMGEAIELSPGNYTVKSPDFEKTVTIEAGKTTELEPELGMLVVSGGGDDSCTVYNADGDRLSENDTGEEVFLPPGAYMIKLNNVGQEVTISAGQKQTLGTGSLFVMGSGNSEYIVYGTPEDELNYVKKKTNQVVELLSGTYTVKLNKASTSVAIGDGGFVVLATGMIGVVGTGNDSYIAHDSNGNRTDGVKTNELMELLPGAYDVNLNNTVRSVSVQNSSVTIFKAGTISVSGTGNDTYSVYDAAQEEKLGSAATNDEIEMFPGTYVVELNKTTLTGRVEEVQAEVLAAGVLTVSGTGTHNYEVYDAAGEDQYGSAKTGEEIELFPDAYLVTLNGITRAATVQAGSTSELPSGVLTVSGTGNDDYFVYDAAGEEQLGSAKTNEKFDMFPGNYLIELNQVRQAASVESGGASELPSGVLTVSGTGNDDYFVYDAAGEEQLGSAKTNEKFDMFPGNYLIELNQVRQTARVQANQETIVQAGRISVSGTESDDYQLYDADENSLGMAKTTQEKEVLAGTYRVELNGETRTAEVGEGEAVVLDTGTISISGAESNAIYMVYDTEDERVDSAQVTEKVDLFPGTYTVELNSIRRTEVVNAGEETILGAGVLSVPGMGETRYYVYDASDKLMVSANTGENADLFPGTCTVKLNKVFRTATVRAGETEMLEAGAITLSGMGKDEYYVYDAAGDQNFAKAVTNDTIEFFPGTYRVRLNKTEQTAIVEGGNTEELAAGSISVSGTGKDFYYIYSSDRGKDVREDAENDLTENVIFALRVSAGNKRASDSHRNADLDGDGKVGLRDAIRGLADLTDPLGLAKTNTEVELFPGTYIVKLNKVTQTVTVEAGEASTLAAGVVTVSGNGNDPYYVYDADGNPLDVSKTNGEVELFPGAYTITLNHVSQIANIGAGASAVLETGTLTVSGTGNDYCKIYDAGGNQLKLAKTNESTALFPGTYTVIFNHASQTAGIEAGDSVSLDF